MAYLRIQVKLPQFKIHSQKYSHFSNKYVGDDDYFHFKVDGETVYEIINSSGAEYSPMRLTIGHNGDGDYSLNTGKVKNLIVEQAADKPTVRLLDEEWSPAACQSSKCFTGDVIETYDFPCPPPEDCSLTTNADGVPFISIISDPQPEICNDDESIYPIYPPEVACSDTHCTTPQVTTELTECVDPCLHEDVYNLQCIEPDFTSDMCVVGEVLTPGQFQRNKPIFLKS